MSGPATYRTEVADPAPQHLLLFCMGSPSTPTFCCSIHIYLLEKEEKTGYYRYVLSSNKSLDRRHIPVIVFFWVIMILTLPLVECVTRSNFSCFLYMYICKYHIYENKWLTKKLIGPRYPIQNSRWDKVLKKTGSDWIRNPACRFPFTVEACYHVQTSVADPQLLLCGSGS